MHTTTATTAVAGYCWAARGWLLRVRRTGPRSKQRTASGYSKSNRHFSEGANRAPRGWREAHPLPRSTGFCAIWDCISLSSSFWIIWAMQRCFVFRAICNWEVRGVRGSALDQRWENMHSCLKSGQELLSGRTWASLLAGLPGQVSLLKWLQLNLKRTPRAMLPSVPLAGSWGNS